MSDLEWFADDFKLAKDFSMAVMPLIYSIKAQDQVISQLIEKEETVKKEIIEATYKAHQLEVLAHTIKFLQEDHKEKLSKLQQIKESFLAEDIVGTLETLTSADSGMEIADATCELMKEVNDLLRNANREKY